MEDADDCRRWEDMETDCLLNVFQRLPLDDLILTLPFVCKSWRRASLDPSCWRSLDFQSSDFSPASRFARRFEVAYDVPGFSLAGLVRLSVRRSCKTAVELKFPLFQRASVDDFLLAVTECPRLRTLAMPNLWPEDELRVPEVVGRHCRELERLEMEVKPSCFAELMRQVGSNCEGLRELAVSGSILRADATAIVSFAPRIRCLDLSRSYLPKEELMVVLRGCGEIERLRVNDCVGFQAEDRDVLELASRVTEFEHHGSKLCDYYVCEDTFGWCDMYVL